MINKARLLKLEQHRPKLVYPSFTDMYLTQDKATYDQWLLDNNIGLTQSMIDELNILHLADLYPDEH
jgi:hypothetical protein